MGLAETLLRKDRGHYLLNIAEAVTVWLDQYGVGLQTDKVLQMREIRDQALSEWEERGEK